MSKQDKKYTISGIVVDQNTGRGIGGLRVEANDWDLIKDDFVGEAVTNPDGSFEIVFYESRFSWLFLDKRPDLYFRIFKGGEKIWSTRDSVLWNIDEPNNWVEIHVHGEILHEPMPAGENQVRQITRQIQVYDQAKGEESPLAGYRVKVFLTGRGEQEPLLLLDQPSDAKGGIVLTIPEPRFQAHAKSTGGRLPIAVQVHGVDDKPVGPVIPVELTGEGDDPVTVPVDTQEYREVLAVPLKRLGEELNWELGDSLNTLLDERGIASLADLRLPDRLGGLDQLPEADNKDMDRLRAHARLQVLNRDTKTNDELIAKGYDSLGSIARITERAFVSSLADSLKEKSACALHKLARKQYHALMNVFTGRRVDEVNHRPTHEPEADPEADEVCHCPECLATVSPLAYLADLLDYTVRHVLGDEQENDPKEIDLDFISDRFHQPFGDLPADCTAMSEPVRQARICIEVLLAWAGKSQQQGSIRKGVNTAVHTQAARAYEALLTELGTSREELNSVRSADARDRNRVATKLGITFDPEQQNDDELKRMFLSGDHLTEQALERLFGIAEVARDPLSTGAKLGDEQGRLLRWRLVGVKWNENTDSDGRIHVVLEKTGNQHQARLYRGAKREDESLVAEGNSEQHGVTVKLQPVNSSGLAGRFELDQQNWKDTESIEIAAVPEYLTWRLRNLRETWCAVDWPDDPYDNDASPVLPFIDPDLIGPEDFCGAVVGSKAFALWEHRRKWVDALLKCVDRWLGALQEEQTLEDMFWNLPGQLHEESYATLSGNSLNGDSWPATEDDFWTRISLKRERYPDFVHHWDDDDPGKSSWKFLCGVMELETDNHTRQEIVDRFGLSLEGFARLEELRDKGLEDLDGDARADTVSILAQVQKRAFYRLWREEENDEQINLWPDTFFPADRDMQVAAWPPHNRDIEPLIDPETVGIEELPRGRMGKAARNKRASRNHQLREMRLHLASLTSWTDRLDEVLGAPSDRDPDFWEGLGEELGTSVDPPPVWSEVMDALHQCFVAFDDAVVETARHLADSVFHLEQDQFERLFRFKQKQDELVDRGETLTPAERSELDSLLLRIWKKEQYPDWLHEEGEQSYWHWRRMQLPAWRASPSARKQWVESLRRNGSPPIVDPDQLEPAWLTISLQQATNPAFDLWKARWNRLCKLWPASGETCQGDNDANDANPAAPILQGQGREWLEQCLTDRNLPENAELRDIAFHALGLTKAELDSLQERNDKRELFDIDPERYGLTHEALGEILRVRKLAGPLPNENPLPDSDSTVLSDWEDVRHILVQAEKRRYLYPKWRRQEQDQDICTGPDLFKLPKLSWMLQRLMPTKETGPKERWRTSKRWQWDWKETLEARVKQQQAIYDALRSAIDEVETATLPALRDKLIKLLVSQEGDLQVKQQWFTNHYLVNAVESGCHVTTRTAQAIDTLQLLIWGLRSGQFEGEHLSLDAPYIEEQWKWIGSYAAWRTAMFVFMYPENLLRPSLRQDASEIYQAAIKVISGWVPAAGESTDGSSTIEREEPSVVDLLCKDIYRHVSISNDPLSKRGMERIQKLIYLYFSHELEGYYYFPIHVALLLQAKSEFISALEWYRKVYDYKGDGLSTELNDLFEPTAWGNYRRFDGWLKDPINPHKIAETRPSAHLRFILLSIIYCLLEYADSEFAKDSAASRSRARELYDTAQRLLNQPELNDSTTDCEKIIAEMAISIGEGEILEVVSGQIEDGRVYPAGQTGGLDAYTNKLLKDIERANSIPEKIAAVEDVVRDNAPQPGPEPLLREWLIGQPDQEEGELDQMLGEPELFEAVQSMESPQTDGEDNPFYSMAAPTLAFSSGYNPDIPGLKFEHIIPAPRFDFCIPPNPLLLILRGRAQMALFKLNNCLNIAGLKSLPDPYGAPTDTKTGLPVALGSERFEAGSGVSYQPTLYKFRALLERAEMLTERAAVVEGSFLNFLERQDQENYQIKHAHQQADLVHAGVQLQVLRVAEAATSILIAGEQEKRASTFHDHYDDLITNGWTGAESWAFGLLIAAAAVQGSLMAVGAIGAGFATWGATGGVAEGLGAAAGAVATGGQALATTSSVLAMYASFERREQEWKFQRELAEHDQNIAGYQVDLAGDHKVIVDQEKEIARLSADQADDLVTFLENKFTSAELYEWMSGILGEVYRYFLQHARATAKLAEDQLAFERQETPLGIVLEDYWDAPLESAGAGQSRQGSEDRWGMTGSARLLRDITRLDQHAFSTAQRKQQLTKTISLARIAPIEFQRFRESGVMQFRTPMEMFDRDYPGHYLRLIKRVRTSVIALIPPTEGIHASLSSLGISRVVIGGDFFQDKVIRRVPETVALSAPYDASGVLELREHPEMLLPFEGSGVDMGWEFSMPKAANQFDYTTIADILISIDYTSIDSWDYRQQVVAKLGRRISVDRPYSFRHQFPDQWYDLHNPAQSEKPMDVTFKTRREDFAPNLSNGSLKIQHVSVYFSMKNGAAFIHDIDLSFCEEGKTSSQFGSATPEDNGVSTRNLNGGSWVSLLQNKHSSGDWTLRFPDPQAAIKVFEEEQVDDILFIITYSGEVPEWPT